LRYTTEVFDTAEELAVASTRLPAALGKGADVPVTLISAAHVQGPA
jgi:hypothetical protein